MRENDSNSKGADVLYDNYHEKHAINLRRMVAGVALMGEADKENKTVAVGSSA